METGCSYNDAIAYIKEEVEKLEKQTDFSIDAQQIRGIKLQQTKYLLSVLEENQW